MAEKENDVAIEERKTELLTEEEEGGDLWLISYADLMTLIACFFILMVAFANYDPVGFTKKTEIVARSFNKDKYKSSMTKMQELTEEVAKHPMLKEMTKVTLHNGEVVITFSSTVIFASGGHTIKDEVAIAVDALIDIIKTKDPRFHILVEGHSDNQNLPPGSPFSSNWALSGARAASVVERFEYFGFEPSRLKAISLGDTEPIVPNEDKFGNPIEENLKLNRRVVIKVLEPLDKVRTKPMKLGLGVYFQ